MIRQLATLTLLIWNCVSFGAYGLDKGRARRGLYRIPEKTLLLLTLAAGGFGAFAGGRVFHHKTRKWYFQTAWIAGIIIDLVLLYLIWR